MADKNTKRQENSKQNFEKKNTEEIINKEDLLSYINNIKRLLEKNIPQSETFLMKRINVLLIKITSLFDSILKENELVLKYELMLRNNENIIRNLYKNIFILKSTIDYQENTIINFVSKEKEYEKLKEKTGAFYSNGKLVYNERKDNEIMILRTENSNLKSFIENKENALKIKDSEIFKLKEQLLLFNKKKKNNDKKKNKNNNNSLSNFNDLKYSYSNININFNEITNPEVLNNCNSTYKNKNKSSTGTIDKTIYIPPQLRNDLSLKELFTRRNIYNLYHHKLIKNKKLLDNYDKINQLSNEEKYISVNKSNYNLLTSKKHERFFSNTINRDINPGTYSYNNSPLKESKKSEKILNLKSYIEKDSIHKNEEKLINKIINKLQHSRKIKKLPFYSSYASPTTKCSNNSTKKNKLFLK